MAERVLAIIPEADVSVAVTGHLGPNAPPELEGLVWLAVGRRKGSDSATVQVKRFELPPKTTRRVRQQLAVEGALRLLASNLEVNDA